MNGLYGYPTPGGMGYVGYLGLTGPAVELTPVQKATVWSVANGDAYESIKAGIEQNREQFKRLDALQASIDSMSSGSAKSQAQEAHRQGVANATAAFGKLAQARGAYNDLVTEIRRNTVVFKPSLLSGLGFEPLSTATVVAAVAVIVGIGFLIDRLTGMIGAWRGNANATEGWIPQIAGLVKAGGGVVHEGGLAIREFKELVEQSGKTATSLAYAALIGVGVWALFKYLKSRQSSASSASPIAAVPVPALSSGAGI